MAVPLLPAALRAVLDDLQRLPGVGQRSAQRIAFHLLRKSPEDLQGIARNLELLHAGTKRCTTCGMLAEGNTCSICANPQRDTSMLCVVETALDVLAIERTGEFHGRYHVLGGALSPLDEIGPEELNIAPLVERVRAEQPREIILALNASVEGETTVLYLKKLFRESGVKVTRLAQGLPTGAALEFADDLTITRALSGRRTLE